MYNKYPDGDVMYVDYSPLTVCAWGINRNRVVKIAQNRPTTPTIRALLFRPMLHSPVHVAQ